MNVTNKGTFVLLSLGANIGNRRETLDKVISALESSGVLRDVRVSSYYETEPVGFKEQDWFLNIAASAHTDLGLYELIQILKSTEYLHGREHRDKWHEREIDIDILLYGSDVCHNEKIIVPHPRMHERKFVLKPAAEIASAAVHPEKNMTIAQLLEECRDDSEVKISA